MALVTTPDAIPTPAASDNFALVTDLLATADRIQAVLTTKANYGAGTTTGRTAALSRFPDGAKWYDTTLSAEYRRVAGAWAVVVSGIPTYDWANAAARTAQTGMLGGYRGYQRDTGVTYRYDGAAWKAWESPWIAWTTAPTGITVGTGGAASSLQQYKYVAGRLCFEYKFILGSSGQSVGTAPYLTVPMNLILPAPRYATLPGDGSCLDSDTSTADYTKARINATTANQVLISKYAGTYSNITATVPWTWAAGDTLGGEFWADPA